MNFIKRFSIILLLALIATPSFSQSIANNEIGGWLMFFNRIRFHENWSMHNEIQDRYHNLSFKDDQLLIRTGLNYHYSKKLWLTAGYAYVVNYPPGDVYIENVKEHRIWQQAMYFHSVGRLALEHRGRVEQRFVGDQYRNRVRYRLMATLPLNNSIMQAQTVFLAAYNEIFMHLEDNPYDRNRLYGAVGYQFTTSTNVQSGYMAQNFAGKTRGYFQLSLTSNIYLLGK